MDELAQNGSVKGGGRRPFGFERDHKTIRPTEAGLINEAVDGCRLGSPPPTGHGARQHRGEVLEGVKPWPAIIDRGRWERLRLLLRLPNRSRLGHPDQDTDIIAITQQLAEDDRLLEELTDFYAAQRITASERMRARAPIERRITQARAKLRRMPKLAPLDYLPDVQDELAAVWPRLPLERQRAILKSVVRRLVIYPGRSGSKFDSRRVVQAFIDRKSPADGSLTAIVPIDLPADDRALDGIRDKIIRSTVPQRETDPGVLDSLARFRNDTQETS